MPVVAGIRGSFLIVGRQTYRGEGCSPQAHAAVVGEDQAVRVGDREMVDVLGEHGDDDVRQRDLAVGCRCLRRCLLPRKPPFLVDRGEDAVDHLHCGWGACSSDATCQPMVAPRRDRVTPIVTYTTNLPQSPHPWRDPATTFALFAQMLISEQELANRKP